MKGEATGAAYAAPHLAGASSDDDARKEADVTRAEGGQPTPHGLPEACKPAAARAINVLEDERTRNSAGVPAGDDGTQQKNAVARKRRRAAAAATTAVARRVSRRIVTWESCGPARRGPARDGCSFRGLQAQRACGTELRDVRAC